MQNWLVFAIFSILGLTSYRIIIKIVGSESMPYIYMVLVSFFCLIGWFLIALREGAFLSQLKTLSPGSFIVIFSLAISFLIADFCLIKAYILGAPLSIMTILLGLSMIFTVIVGVLLFKETINWLQVIGIVFGLASFIILSVSAKN